MRELTCSAVVENVDEVTDFVVEELRSLGCASKIIVQVSVAIDEIFSNIANYAYNPKVGSATIRTEVLDDPLRVVITFLDNGVRFDPFAAEDPDVSAPLEDRGMGGLGILLVKKSMDDVQYEYVEGQNILKISKLLGER